MRQWTTLAAAAVVFVGCAPKVSDTGYVGTWARSSPQSASTIAIYRDDAGYRFRWKVDTPSGKWRVRCDWNGRCEEHIDGEKAAEYLFTTRIDPATGHLVVDCTGKVSKPRRAEIHYVDELVVEPGGLTLWSYTLERGGQRFEGEARPKRSYRKVADEVGEKPR